MLDDNLLSFPLIHLGDLLISHRKNFHYVVELIDGNIATIFWLHRKSGERYQLITYRRKINLDRAPLDYDVYPGEQVDWTRYLNTQLIGK